MSKMKSMLILVTVCIGTLTEFLVTMFVYSIMAMYLVIFIPELEVVMVKDFNQKT